MRKINNNSGQALFVSTFLLSVLLPVIYLTFTFTKNVYTQTISQVEIESEIRNKYNTTKELKLEFDELQENTLQQFVSFAKELQNISANENGAELSVQNLEKSLKKLLTMEKKLIDAEWIISAKLNCNEFGYFLAEQTNVSLSSIFSSCELLLQRNVELNIMKFEPQKIEKFNWQPWSKM